MCIIGRDIWTGGVAINCGKSVAKTILGSGGIRTHASEETGA